MRRFLCMAGLLISVSGASAKPDLTVATLPTLIGRDAASLAELFGPMKQPCRPLDTGFVVCTYEATQNSDQVSLTFKNGRLVDLHWWPRSLPRTDISDLGLTGCTGPKVEISSGSPIWNDCVGGLSARIENADKGLFSISLSTRSFMAR